MARQITFYKFEVGTIEFKQADDGRYDLVKQPVCEIEDSSLTRGDIRQAIKATGYELKRGTEVYADKKSKILYKFTTEALMSICESREELPLD